MKRFIKYLLFFALVIIVPSNLQAQRKSNYPTDKKAKKYFKKGIKNFQSNKYNKAIKNLDKAIKLQPDFVKSYLYKASIYFELKDYPKCENQYLTVLQIDSTYSNDIYYSLGIVLEKQGKLDEALHSYKRFLSKSRIKGKLEKKAKLKVKNLPFIIKALKNPVSFNPIKLDEGINSDYSEYLPALTGDKQNMIFTRRINNQEDFYFSSFNDSKWEIATPINELNTLANEGAHTLSPDGKTLIFTICDRKRTYGSCDLFISYKKSGVWSKPQNLGLTINSSYWDSQPSISADGKSLYFSSNRPNGIGGKDIWVSHKLKSNLWSKPVCLDTIINTEFNEETPFIHTDNQTLYFTSNGHPGMGGKDLFFSKKSKQKWQKAINLGYPINTENEEGALFVTLDGISGYFSSDRQSGSSKNLDIYYFEFPKQIRPKPVTYIKGIVIDAEDKKTIKAIINLYNNDTGEKIDSIISGSDSFFISLPIGIDYNLTVNKTGYAFYSDRFVLKENNSLFNPYRLSIELVKLATVETKVESPPIVLKNIIFKTNSSEINTEKSKIELTNLYNLLLNNPKIKIRINGHTDNVGELNYNLKLSENRAKAVYDYLKSKGILQNRLKYYGFGETKPIVPNNTEDGRNENRRVEFVIY